MGLFLVGCSNNVNGDTASLTVDIGYSPSTLTDILDNVQIQLIPLGSSGQVVTVDLGPNANRTVFGGLAPGFYKVLAVGRDGNFNIAFGEVNDILVIVGNENQTFVVLSEPQ